MRLVIADDHALIRDSLAMLLQTCEPDWQIDQTGDLTGLVRLLTEGNIDLALIDLNMSEKTSEALAGLREQFPNTKIAVLTGLNDRGVILDCLSAGVHGYVLKTENVSVLRDAIRSIFSGNIYVPAQLSNLSSSPASLAGDRMYSKARLTGGQEEVLQLLATGLSTKGIARQLSLGLGTVKVHLAGVYKALDAHSRLEAVAKAGDLLQIL